MTFVPFIAANTICDRFLELLRELNINPPVGSSLEDELLSLTQLVEIIKNPTLATGSNKDRVLRAAAGLHDLAAKVLAVRPLPEFDKFVPHLRLIAERKVRVASLGQNAQNAYDDDTARKTAELYIGCLAAHIGKEVDLDSPTTAKGDNPDVMLTVEEVYVVKESRRWALAIKTISTHNGQTIFERIRDGARQINDPKCKADHGMVIINTKSALDHDALWNQTFRDEREATAALCAQLRILMDAASENRPAQEWNGLFQGKVMRPVIFMGQSIVRLPTFAGNETPTPLKAFMIFDAVGVNERVGLEIAAGMNHFMQSVLQGIPGSSDQLPR